MRNFSIPDNLDDGFRAFHKACHDMAQSITVRRAAEHLDFLLCLPELIDTGALQSRQAPLSPAVEVSDLGEETRANIYSHGFAFAVEAFRDDALAAAQLGKLARNPVALREIFDRIRATEQIPDDWMDRFLCVGRALDLRVFDLKQGRPVALGTENGRRLWPSPFNAEFQGSTLTVGMRGLNKFAGRNTHCGLFPLGSDRAFSRRSLSEALARNCPTELGDTPVHRDVWEKVEIDSEGWKMLRSDLDAWKSAPISRAAWDSLTKAVPKAPVYHFRIHGDKETIQLGPIPSRQSLTNQVLVIVVE